MPRPKRQTGKFGVFVAQSGGKSTRGAKRYKRQADAASAAKSRPKRGRHSYWGIFKDL